MNRQQQNLLELLKLLDGICKKYNIIYYAAGGTVIGAIRHGGFIPWDDDIDVYMTRDEFNRFREAVRMEKMTDYTLECSMDNPDYHAMIPRIIKNNSTMICAYHMWGNSVAGTLIDIFILDPIPQDPEKQDEHYARFNIYSDLLTPYVHSDRNPDSLYGLYDQYMKEAREKGKRETLLELEKELFSWDEEECKSYMLRWASRPAVFPKEMMGTPEYFEFEGMMVPVPHDWYGYLTQLYGPDWFEIPHPEVIEHHTNVIDLDRSYKEFITERDRYIDQKDAEEIFDGRRDAAILAERKRRIIEKYILNIKSTLADNKLKKNLKNAGTLMDTWMKEGEYSKILEVFEPYFTFQMQRCFIGAANHPSWFRWRYPVLIPVEGKYLKYAIIAQIMSGKIRDAHKILGVYERAGKLTDEIQEADKLLKKVEKVQELYYKGQYEESIRLIQSCENYEKSIICQTYYWLSKAKIQPISDDLQQLEEVIKENPDALELKKAYGDYLFALGKQEKARKVYDSFVFASRNGLLLQDVEQRSGIQKNNLNHETTEIYKPSEIEKRELELLQQLTEICDKNGIAYVCSNRVARLLLNNGTLGPDKQEKQIYIDSKDTERLIEAVAKSNNPNVEILYWGNKPAIKNFQLIYNDRNSIYMDFKQLNCWESVGIHINIVLLRHRANNEGLREKMHSAEETMLNAYNLEGAAQRAVASRSAGIKNHIVNAILKIIGNQRFAKHLFKVLIRDSRSNEGSDYFYRNNGPFENRGGFFNRRTYLKKDFENVENYEINGHSYRMRKDIVDSFTQEDIVRMKPVPYYEDLFSLRSLNLSWKELEQYVSKEKYSMLPWEEYGMTIGRRNYYQSRYSRMWKIMCRHQDCIEIWKEYEPLLPALRNLLKSEDQEQLRMALADYDRVVRYYHNAKIDFFVNRELNEIYLENRKFFGDKKYAENLKRKAEETEYWPF